MEAGEPVRKLWLMAGADTLHLAAGKGRGTASQHPGPLPRGAQPAARRPSGP